MRPQRIGNCADHGRRQLRRARTIETIVPAVISCEPPPNLQGFGATECIVAGPSSTSSHIHQEPFDINVCIASATQ